MVQSLFGKLATQRCSNLQLHCCKTYFRHSCSCNLYIALFLTYQRPHFHGDWIHINCFINFSVVSAFCFIKCTLWCVSYFVMVLELHLWYASIGMVLHALFNWKTWGNINLSLAYSCFWTSECCIHITTNHFIRWKCCWDFS